MITGLLYKYKEKGKKKKPQNAAHHSERITNVLRNKFLGLSVGIEKYNFIGMELMSFVMFYEKYVLEIHSCWYIY